MEGTQAASAAPAAAATAAQPVKRKRGRPRKSETAQGIQGIQAQGTEPGVKPKKQRKRKGDGGVAMAPPPQAIDVSMIGQQVTGVLEGTFDAGYLLSVRVGSSDTILRGVVFGPGLSVPLSKLNDVAPGVKQVRREEKAVPVAVAAAKPLPSLIAPKPVHAFPFMVPCPSSIPPTSAVLESAAALFGNSLQAPAPPAPPATGLVAALQQLPGGGYTPDPSAFGQAASFRPESVKSL